MRYDNYTTTKLSKNKINNSRTRLVILNAFSRSL